MSKYYPKSPSSKIFLWMLGIFWPKYRKGYVETPDNEPNTFGDYLQGGILFVLLTPLWLLLLPIEFAILVIEQFSSTRTTPPITSSSSNNIYPAFLKAWKNSTIKIKNPATMSGKEFENFLKELFLRQGYSVTFLSPGVDQGGDLIISKDGRDTVVQAKRYAQSVSNKAVQEVVGAINYYQCYDAMVVTTGSFTTSAVKLARANGVTLIDGRDLQKLIDASNPHPSSQKAISS